MGGLRNGPCEKPDTEKMSIPVTRLICVTSINQLVVALACLAHNRKDGQVYNDYLIVNNTEVSNNASNMIMGVGARIHNFKKIIDFRVHLAELKRSLKNAGILRLVFSNPDIISNMAERLREEINNNPVSEIYLRYKINLPEHLVLKTFPTANCFCFEDGMKEYMEPVRRNISFKFAIAGFIYAFKKDSVLRSFLLQHKYNNRIASRFSVIFNDERHVNIKKHYANVLDKIALSTKISDAYPGDYILLVLVNYSERLSANAEVDDEMVFYRKLIGKMKELYPDKKLMVKAHPNTSPELRSRYSMLFGESLIDNIQDVPCEVLIALPNVNRVIGAMSSSLLYAKECFGKSSFLVVPYFIKDFTKWQSVKETLTRYGVQEIVL
jgi:hypothetical protein